jgi:hypothetical protein
MYYTHRSQYDRVKESVRYNAQFSDTLGIPSKTQYLPRKSKDPELSVSSKGTPKKMLQRIKHVDRIEPQDLSMVSGSHAPDQQKPFLTRKHSCNASMQPFLRKGQQIHRTIHEKTHYKAAQQCYIDSLIKNGDCFDDTLSEIKSENLRMTRHKSSLGHTQSQPFLSKNLSLKLASQELGAKLSNPMEKPIQEVSRIVDPRSLIRGPH